MKTESKLFYKSVFALIIPIALQNLINVGVSAADVVMLGLVGETALSGASLAGQVQFIMMLLIFGMTSGAVVLTAQYWGKKDTRTIEKVMGITMRFAILAALLFTVAVQLFPYQTMRIFSNETEVIESGVQYLRLVSLSYIIASATQVYLNVIRSIERVIISTVVYAISLVVNICLNAIFIFGLLGIPAMGVQGAALATTLARVIEFLIVAVYAFRFNHVVRVRFSDLFVREPLLFHDFLKYSIPVMLNELFWGMGSSMNSVVIGHMGSAAVAANSVAQVARQLAQVVGFGVAAAAAIMLGKAIGANESERAERDSKRFIWISLISGVFGAAVVLIARPISMATLNLSGQSRDYLSFMMFVMAYFVIAQTYNTTQVVGIFRSGGDTKFGLAMDVGTMWFFSIPLGALAAFVFHWNVYVVYAILMCDEIIKLPLTTWRYRKKYWLKNVTR